MLKNQVDKGDLPAGRTIKASRRDDFAAALGKGTRAAEFYLTGESAVHERDIGKLLDHLFGDDPHLANARAALARAWEADSGKSLTPETPANVPRLVRALVGREDDIKLVTDTLLASADSVTILVQGSPGIGKTALTKAVASQADVITRFGARRYFVELEQASTTGKMHDAIITALGCDPAQGFAGLLAGLHGRQTLLILDNLETPWDPREERAATQETLAALAGVPGVALLASFRGRDRVRGLDWALVHPVPELATPAARELFGRIAGPWVLDDPALDTFLGVLGGVPLAIELVAHRADGSSTLAPLWAEWEKVGVRLAEDPDFTDTRLTSLAHSIELSLKSSRISPAAKRLFGLLGVLPAGLVAADRDALLGSEAFDAQDRLRRIGLAIERPGRIDLLPPIRDHARRHYAPEGDDAAAWAGHFLRITQELGDAIGTQDGDGAITRLQPEFGNIEAAFLAMIDCGERAKAMASINGLGQLTYIAALTTPVFGKIAAACHADGDVQGEADCIQCFGNMALARSDHDGAKAAYEQALPLYQHLGDLRGETNCIESLGDIALRRSDHDGAKAAYEQALPVYRRVGDVLGEANCIFSLGDIALRRSDHDGAKAAFAEVLPLYQLVGSVLGEANCIRILGEVALARSDHDGAEAAYGQALPLYRRVGDLNGEANCINGLGDIALARSDHDGAKAAYEQALPLYQRVGDVLGEANCIRSLGDIALRRSDDHVAKSAFEKALLLYRRIGNAAGEAACSERLSRFE
jgi:tetratricopeptide (TPR) repeat protein